MLGCMVGSALLDEREHRVEHDDGEDRHAELGQAREERQPARHPEHQREEVEELACEAPDG